MGIGIHDALILQTRRLSASEHNFRLQSDVQYSAVANKRPVADRPIMLVGGSPGEIPVKNQGLLFGDVHSADAECPTTPECLANAFVEGLAYPDACKTCSDAISEDMSEGACSRKIAS